MASGAVPDGLLRELWADPPHAAETFALHAARRLGPSVSEEAAGAQPSASSALDRAAVRRATRLTTIYGAIAGTPLFLALVPAYVAMLWEQARMVLRIAAFNGRETTEIRAAAELLVLRRVHPTLERAEAAVREHLEGERQHLPRHRALFNPVRALLVLGGFVQPKELDAPRGRLKAVATILLGVAVWAITWVIPFTFILVMSWSCRDSSRGLAARALGYYEPGEAGGQSLARGRRSQVELVAAVATCALPAALLFIAARWHPDGIDLGRALAALAGLALVLILAGRGSRALTGS